MMVHTQQFFSFTCQKCKHTKGQYIKIHKKPLKTKIPNREKPSPKPQINEQKTNQKNPDKQNLNPFKASILLISPKTLNNKVMEQSRHSFNV